MFLYFTTVNPGYKLVWLRVDDVKDTTFTSTTYTFTDVEKNHTLHAHFKKIKQPK